jgi:hypothetical protein
MILGVATAIMAIVCIVMSTMGIEQFKDYKTVYFIIVAVGSFIEAALLFGFGKKVMGGSMPKIEILAQYVKIVGIVTIIGGICNAVAQFVGVDGTSAGTAVGGAVFAILIGLIILLIASKINDGKQTTGDKVIWIILLVLFVLGIFAAVGEIILIVTAPLGIIDLLIYVYMLTLLVDPEVKSQMNM